MSVSFLTPVAALIALGVLLPLAAALGRERRAERFRRALRLETPSLRAHRGFLGASVAFFVLVGLAAAQPVARWTQEVRARTDVEAFFLLDVSKSMLAARSPVAPTRFDRAVDLALRLRSELRDVPTGVASMTDRPLPHLFPTQNPAAFSAVFRRAVGVDRPPPSGGDHIRATDFQTIEALARDNYFSAKSVRRLVILLTDGETRPFDPDELVEELEGTGVSLVIVRFWNADERIYFDGNGREDPLYRPSRSSDAAVARLASVTSSGQVFGEGDVDGILAAAHAYLGEGPALVAGERRRATPLAPYFVLAAAVPLALLVARRTL